MNVDYETMKQNATYLQIAEQMSNQRVKHMENNILQVFMGPVRRTSETFGIQVTGLCLSRSSSP